MTGRPDEVHASVFTKITLLAALGLLLLGHVRLMLVVNEVDRGRSQLAVVDVVTKTGRVDDCELDLELFLLELSLDDLDFRELVELLVVTSAVNFQRGWLSRDERVDKSGLSPTRFALIKR
jgi:hypothetical protein